MTDTDTAVLVAGAGGFIGGHLVARLMDEGFTRIRAVDIKPTAAWHQSFPNVENLQLDLAQKGACEHAMKGMTHVYNLAADMGGMGFIEGNKAACMLSVLINTHLLLAARDCGAQRYFYASSACVYAADKQTSTKATRLREEDAYPAMPEDGYGWEKLFAERMCRHFSEDFGLQTRIARYHNVYGPHGTYDGGREKAPAAICRKVIEAKRDDRDTIEIWGDGKQTRSFLFVTDCIEGTRRMMESTCSDPINIGSEQLVSIDGLVDRVESIAGVQLKRTYDLTAPQGVRGRSSDNTRAQEVLGWSPQISLETGMRSTYHWIYEQIAAAEERAPSPRRIDKPADPLSRRRPFKS